jgi:hypothetical protein
MKDGGYGGDGGSKEGIYTNCTQDVNDPQSVYLGSQRVAMRVAPTGSYSGALYWIQGEQLGSASLTTNITGTVVSEQRYYPFGETRWVSGTMPTDRLFSGQRTCVLP